MPMHNLLTTRLSELYVCSIESLWQTIKHWARQQLFWLRKSRTVVSFLLFRQSVICTLNHKSQAWGTWVFSSLRTRWSLQTHLIDSDDFILQTNCIAIGSSTIKTLQSPIPDLIKNLQEYNQFCCLPFQQFGSDGRVVMALASGTLMRSYLLVEQSSWVRVPLWSLSFCFWSGTTSRACPGLVADWSQVVGFFLWELEGINFGVGEVPAEK